MSAAGKITAEHRAERRARERKLTREAILEAARRVAAREGAANLSLRAVAAEAGFAPAALYGYFTNKSELLIALAAEDLSGLARVLRAARGEKGASRLGAAAEAALALLQNSETFATAPAALPAEAGSSEAERLFNGRLIAVLRALSDAAGHPADSPEAQADIVLLAAALAGLAVFARSGRLAALGFSPADMIAALDRRFLPAP
jgi:AcrR family transcriptional regulator